MGLGPLFYLLFWGLGKLLPEMLRISPRPTAAIRKLQQKALPLSFLEPRSRASERFRGVLQGSEGLATRILRGLGRLQTELYSAWFGMCLEAAVGGFRLYGSRYGARKGELACSIRDVQLGSV